ncbi:MAG: ATP-binding protein, partial [Thermodesulfobacteriota bacterium]
FDPFFTTRPLKGRGLGLSASYGIIKRHGGKIVLEREEGKGCIFTLELPISSQR